MEATFRYILKQFLDPYISGLDGKIDCSASAVNIVDLKIRDELLNTLREGNDGPLELQEARIGRVTLQAVKFGKLQVVASEVVFDLDVVPGKVISAHWNAGKEEREAAAPGFVHLLKDAPSEGYWSALVETSGPLLERVGATGPAPPPDEIRANYCMKHFVEKRRRRAGVRVVDCKVCGEKVRTNFTLLALCVRCSLRSGRCLHCASVEVPVKIPYTEEAQDPDMAIDPHMVVPLGERTLLDDGFQEVHRYPQVGSGRSDDGECVPPPSAHAQDRPAVPPSSRKGVLLGAGHVPAAMPLFGPDDGYAKTTTDVGASSKRSARVASKSPSPSPSRSVTPTGRSTSRWEAASFEMPMPVPRARSGDGGGGFTSSDDSDNSENFSPAHREILKARKMQEVLEQMLVPDTEDPCRASSTFSVNPETRPALEAQPVKRRVKKTRRSNEEEEEAKPVEKPLWKKREEERETALAKREEMKKKKKKPPDKPLEKPEPTAGRALREPEEVTL